MRSSERAPAGTPSGDVVMLGGSLSSLTIGVSVSASTFSAYVHAGILQ